MNDYLLHNGTFYKTQEPLVTADNRGLRYGDGLFETFKLSDNGIHFRDWHFERLFYGLQLLGFELPAYFTAAYLFKQVISLCKKNGYSNARVRINIIRGNGGLYDPENHFPNTIIQAWPLPTEGYHLNENGLVTGVYQDARKAIDGFSGIKSNNYLPYTMAALHAKKNKWNDALLLNTRGTVCDASIANVFIIKDEIITTCPLEDGCVAGIMRKYLIQNLPEKGFHFRERQITVDDLMTADEVFLTNVIRGIRWIHRCDEASYGIRLTTAIHNKLLKEML